MEVPLRAQGQAVSAALATLCLTWVGQRLPGRTQLCHAPASSSSFPSCAQCLELGVVPLTSVTPSGLQSSSAYCCREHRPGVRGTPRSAAGQSAAAGSHREPALAAAVGRRGAGDAIAGQQPVVRVAQEHDVAEERQQPPRAVPPGLPLCRHACAATLRRLRQQLCAARRRAERAVHAPLCAAPARLSC